MSVIESALALGSCLIKNRIGFAPVNMGSAGMQVNRVKAVQELYAQFAISGLGLAYIGGIAVNERGRSNRSSMVMQNRETVELVSRVATTVAAEQMVIAVQLMHSGRQASQREIGCVPLAASALACPYYREVPAAATLSDISDVVRAFASAAKAAESTGCGLVEVHAAHGYLVSGFLSTSTNRRNDSYGGSTRNRFRILNDILGAVREATAIAVGVRVNVREQNPGGLEIAELIDGLGGLRNRPDFVSVTGGMYTIGSDDLIIPHRRMGRALWRREAAMIREQLAMPTLIAGNIETIAVAEKIIGCREADAVLMARALLADPRLYEKSRREAIADVQACTELYLCKYHSRGAEHVYCPHNGLMRQSMRPRVDPTFATRKASDH